MSLSLIANYLAEEESEVSSVEGEEEKGVVVEEAISPPSYEAGLVQCLFKGYVEEEKAKAKPPGDDREEGNLDLAMMQVWPFTHCKIILSREETSREGKRGWTWEGKEFVFYDRISLEQADGMALDQLQRLKSQLEGNQREDQSPEPQVGLEKTEGEKKMGRPRKNPDGKRKPKRKLGRPRKILGGAQRAPQLRRRSGRTKNKIEAGKKEEQQPTPNSADKTEEDDDKTEVISVSVDEGDNCSGGVPTPKSSLKRRRSSSEEEGRRKRVRFSIESPDSNLAEDESSLISPEGDEDKQVGAQADVVMEVEAEVKADVEEEPSKEDTDDVDLEAEFRCPFCLLTFPKPEELIGHLQTHKKGNGAVAEVKPASKPDPEGQARRGRSGLRGPKSKCKAKSMSDLSPEPSFKERESSNKRWERKALLAEADNKTDVESQISEIPLGTGKSLFKCGTCGLTFNARWRALRHLSSHTSPSPKKFSPMKNSRAHGGEKQFKCPLCPQRFSDWEGLRYHEQTHSSEGGGEGRQHKCDHDHCDKSFNDLSALRTHLEVHTEKKRHKCFDCGERFKDTNSLRLHELSEHPDSDSD